jgi:hypothetical protein
MAMAHFFPGQTGPIAGIVAVITIGLAGRIHSGVVVESSYPQHQE